ncbi:hypothetical protein GALL_366180 [mine drainage metagenome]|uniref:DUF2889 domain-containing protein n=1 Tax=mine drainage metagenome TaxID=410659 RepID=A0A1J5R0C0_9ZZZZ
MPLPLPSAPRHRTHTRSIVLEGWKRDDGLWDIEARLTDLKDHDYPLASGLRARGEAVHDMLVRLTIDTDFMIVDAVAAIDAVPYPGCEAIAPAYRKLIGLNLTRGFRQRVGEMFGTVAGCSHLTELLSSLPTAAIQTFAGEQRDTDIGDGTKPFQLDRCHALDTSGATVRRYYPRWYRPGGRDKINPTSKSKEDA